MIREGIESADIASEPDHDRELYVPGGRQPALLRFGPYVAMALLVLLVVATASSPLTNYDTFFHLRLGQKFSDGWSLTQPGHFNQFGSRHWVPTQWLAEMGMYRFEQWFGLAGVAWLAGTWFLGLTVALLVVCRRQAPPIIATSVAAFAVLACHYGLSARPQVLSYILVTVVVHAWLRTEVDGKPRWWLIPLTWVWAMLHGMWILGIVTSFVAAAAMSLDKSRPARVRWSYLGVPVGMMLAGALTPVGPRLYGAVLLVGSRSDLFTEWKPADYTDPFNAVLALMLAATVGLGLRFGSSSWMRTGLTLLALGWALYSQRTVPIAAVTIAPLLCRQLASHAIPEGRLPRPEKATLTVAAVAALVVLAFTAHNAAEIDEPAWVPGALGSLPHGTPIIADMGAAGYLAWQYPNVSPLVTGYADMYTDRELRDNRKLMELHPGWDGEIRRLNLQWALVGPKSQIAYALTHFEHWRTVGSAKDVVLLRAPEASAP